MDIEFIQAVQDFTVNISEKTKVYIGADSRRRKRVDGSWQISYTTVAVFHLDGKHGAKVFASVDREKDHHGSLQLRLMGEVYRAVELFGFLSQVLEKERIEIHLDIASSPKHKSNVVHSQACGYVIGMTGIEPKTKPQAWAASTCADLCEIKFDL